LLADFLGLGIRVPASTESTATGAAITAGIGFGIFSPEQTAEKSSNQPTIYSPREGVLDISDHQKWKEFLKFLMQTYS
jgi:glycerol kinase